MWPSWPIFHSALRNQGPSKEKRFEPTESALDWESASPYWSPCWVTGSKSLPSLGFHVPICGLVGLDSTTTNVLWTLISYLCSGSSTKLQGPRERLRPKEMEYELRGEVVNGRRFPAMYPGPIGIALPCLFRCRIHSLRHSFNSIDRASGATGSEFECYDFWMMTLLVAIDLSQKPRLKPWVSPLVVMWGCAVISAPWDSGSC